MWYQHSSMTIYFVRFLFGAFQLIEENRWAFTFILNGSKKNLMHLLNEKAIFWRCVCLELFGRKKRYIKANNFILAKT